MVHWPSYNETLVRRGEIMMDFDVIDGWKEELDNMNAGKEGALYMYPESFVHSCLGTCARISIYHIDRLKVL